MGQFLNRFFKLKENNTTISTEVFAGISTFMTMAYIIMVNPSLLSASGMPFDSLMVSTCLAAAFGTLLMALFANMPVALASGMGLNAFFSFSVVIGMGVSWQTALTAIFIEGVIFIVLTLTSLREKIVNAIPKSLKIGITSGIGIFIAFIGFQNSGIIVNDDATLVALTSDLSANYQALLSILGLVIIGALEARRVRGAILWGIVAITVISIPLGVTQMPSSVVSMPPSIAPIFGQLDFSLVSIDISDPAVAAFWGVVFTFFFVDFFDTLGALVGIASVGGMLDERGNIRNARGALLADAVATAGGAVLGVSTVTSYIESASGVEVGGRTGLTAVVTALLFLLAIFFSPLIAIVPSCATAPALIVVGIYMLMSVRDLNFGDWTELLPSALTIFVMPFAYSIAIGIEFGIITYTLVKLFTGRAREVSPFVWLIAIVFVAKELLM